MSIYLKAKHDGFENEEAAIDWVMFLMEGEAADWAFGLMGDIGHRRTGAPHTLEEFMRQFLENFGDPDAERQASRKIKTLVQTTTTSEYTTEFKNLAAELDWNDRSLYDHYLQGLHWKLKDQIAFLEVKPPNLSALITKAIHLDGRRRESEADRPQKQNKPKSSSSTSGNKATTSTTTTRVTLKESGNYVDDAEKERRRKAGVCVKCGKAGHSFEECRTGWKATKKEEKKEEKKVKKESGAVAVIEPEEESESESEKE